ncbi:N-terminal acetyltransferase B complex auxiliary subunit NAA25-like isoform X2 [Papaver somniferum]|uniref:N-terminal acetyltransferase B complex auxiliary subunit NAA25-like isoform X2 n=1 Tax=Papaver somniferum TaxID=3469 RepID=UPI000E7059AC|nr:N-terminal acetyltransferase B complex auxiliary subunit NAA25-like isoform X2 [Papaver somniferum]
MKALKHIKALQSEFPSSALVLALKVLVYAIIGGEVGVSSVLSKTEAKVFSDISAFPDVLTTFEAVWLHLGHLDKATYIYEFARVEDCNSFGLMRRLFNCYSHKSLFVKQLKVSLKMYKLVREDKFLFWAVFCIHLQVLSLLIKKHGMDNLLDEPESILQPSWYTCL